MKKAVYSGSLKRRIMTYTILPVAAVLLATAVIMTATIRHLIERISVSEAVGSTELTCEKIDDIIGKYGDIVKVTAEKENLKRFLQTAVSRDEIYDNAYFSYVMGELDSAFAEHSYEITRIWIASKNVPNVAFANSSDGWTAAEDYDIADNPYHREFTANAGCYITDPYISAQTGIMTISAVAPVRDTRTNVILGYVGADIDTDRMWERISSLPDAQANTIIIYASDGSMVYHSGKHITTDDRNITKPERTAADSFVLGGVKMLGTEYSAENSALTAYALRDFRESETIINRYTLFTAGAFAAVLLCIFAALTFASKRIAQPIQDYTRMINEMNTDAMTAYSGKKEILQPEGCRELEQLAVSFNALIQRNSAMLVQLRDMNIKSEKERILYQTALQSSSDVVYEYDIETDTLITYGSVFNIDMPKTQQTVYESFVNNTSEGSGMHVSDDTASLKEFFSGNTEYHAAVSRKMSDGTVRWAAFEGLPVFSEGVPVKIVGKIKCIDDVISLRQDADKDAFTGFYNKTATEKLISKRLEDNCSGTLIIIDADNFKAVNDKLGHAYGDYVIKDIAGKIAALTGDDSIRGRIGGDEFMVFMPLCGTEAVSKLCGKLCRSICTCYKENDTEVTVSASIGTAFAPKHGSTFEELYSSADIALYISKDNGKNCFTLFDGQSRPEYSGR